MATHAPLSLPSLNELGLLGQQSPPWRAWRTARPPDYGRQVYRDSLLMRKRRAGHRERCFGGMVVAGAAALFASGPLPSPGAHGGVDTGHWRWDWDWSRSTERPETLAITGLALSMSAGFQRYVWRADREFDAKAGEGFRRKEEREAKTDKLNAIKQAETVVCSHDIMAAIRKRRRPTPPILPTWSSPVEMRGKQLCVSKINDDDNNEHGQRWAPQRTSSKRKREESPTPVRMGRGGKDDSDGAGHKATTLHASLHGVSQVSDTSGPFPLCPDELYVIYKFDRVDELGGRRRGHR